MPQAADFIFAAADINITVLFKDRRGQAAALKDIGQRRTRRIFPMIIRSVILVNPGASAKMPPAIAALR